MSPSPSPTCKNTSFIMNSTATVHQLKRSGREFSARHISYLCNSQKMENFGSEIGQKMRSAVKAKLLELGTGGTAGYIDDELPDYVMIMVANKRSKQQMISDLNLFLGSQTELFVTWLHEVLHKLQEVTLPAANATAKKRKASQKEEVVSKKDRKSGKKDKRSSSTATDRKSADESHSPQAVAEKPSSSNTIPVPPINSITDVFADVFLEKAKMTLDSTVEAAAYIKKAKTPKSSSNMEANDSDNTMQSNDFNIPTISEISSTTENNDAVKNTSETVVSGDRAKDLAELAEIQKRIYAAKKHLKHLGELDNDEQDEDDGDFINLKEDGSVGENTNEPMEETPTEVRIDVATKRRSPIVFDKEDKNVDNVKNPPEGTSEHSRQRHFTPPPLPSNAWKSSSGVGRQNEQSNVRGLPVSRQRSREREQDRNHNRDRERDSDRYKHDAPVDSAKRSVHERLGLKPASRGPLRNAKRTREDKELYVPAFRRKENEKDRERERNRERDRKNDRDRNTERDRERDRDRERERDHDRDRTEYKRGDHELLVRERGKERPSRERSRDHANRRRESNSGNRRATPTSRRRTSSREHQLLPLVTVSGTHLDKQEIAQTESSEDETQTRQRIGSRVIVAPIKQTESSEEEDEKPVNSVIKIKPRPPVSPSKQATKNLLLRAMADAQRSAILNKSKPKEVTAKAGSAIKESKGERTLYTKAYRNRLKRNAVVSSSSTLFRRATQNLVIEVDGSLPLSKRRRQHSITPHAEEHGDEDEYMEESSSEANYAYVPQSISHDSSTDRRGNKSNVYDEINEDMESNGKSPVEDLSLAKTQFVVTLNDEKAPHKFSSKHSRSASPLPQVSSSSSVLRYNNVEATSTTHLKRSNTRDSRLADIKSRFLIKAIPSSTAARISDQDSSNSTPSTPPPRRSELIETYRRPKEIKKIIIKNDSDDEELSPKKFTSLTGIQRNLKREKSESADEVERSTTPPIPPKAPIAAKRTANEIAIKMSPKRRRTPISFKTLPEPSREKGRETKEQGHERNNKRRSNSVERERKLSHDKERVSDKERDRSRDRNGTHEHERNYFSERRSGEERRKISIRNLETKKYDNIPSLSSVTLDSTAIRVMKTKERCKYHPNCTKQFCDYYHPTAPCKSFPNCKFADKCMYSHPHCKYDLACTNIDCNYAHSGPRNPAQLQPTAPPLSSHVVPVQNYKSISATAVGTAMCKYYPNCSKVGCTFYHPKPCRFGKNCINKLECNFYHHEVQSSSKFKWVATVV